jgi:hypothetical protein
MSGTTASILVAIWASTSSPSSAHQPAESIAGASVSPEFPEKPATKSGAADVSPAEQSSVESPETPARFSASALSFLRGSGVAERRVVDAVLVTLHKARDIPSVSDRDAIKVLVTRAAAEDGDLVLWTVSAGADADQVLLALGRGVAVKRLAAKLGHLSANRIGIQVGVGDSAATDRILLALLAPASSPEIPAVEPQVENKPAEVAQTPSPAQAAPVSPPAPAATPPNPLRAAIIGFYPALKTCVQVAQKSDPSLHGEARVQLDIASSGSVKLTGIRSATLAGGGFEDCVRRAAGHWTTPRMSQGYQAEIPLRILSANAKAR